MDGIVTNTQVSPFPRTPDGMMVPIGNTPVLPVMSAAQVLESERQKEAAKEKADQMATDPVKSQLLTYVKTCLENAKQARTDSGVEDILLECQRRRDGKYSSTKEAELKKYGFPVVWCPLSQIKCNAAEAWMQDIYVNSGEAFYTIQPTPKPDLPESLTAYIKEQIIKKVAEMVATGVPMTRAVMLDMMDDLEQWAKKQYDLEAIERANRMQRVVQDQLTECDFNQTFREFRANVTTFGTGFLKGPIVEQVKRRKWSGDKIEVVKELVPTVTAPAPLDIFPSPWATDVKDGYIIERFRAYRGHFSKVKDIEYWRKDEIERLLTDYREGNSQAQHDAAEGERALNESKTVTAKDDRMECFEFWGPVQGHMLKDWGVEVEDETMDYEVQVVWSGDYLLKVMPNWNDIGTRPYFKSCYKRKPGSFWGIGIPMLMSAAQDKANNSLVSLYKNMAWVAGPIAEVDQTRLVNPKDAFSIFPGKVFVTKNEMGLTAPAVHVFKVDSAIAEIQAIYQSSLADADNESGVPAYIYGSDKAAGAGRTYSGLITLMNSAARGIKDAINDIDVYGLGALLKNLVDWNNEYSQDSGIKGDVRVQANGASGLFMREQQLMKLTEFIDRTNNPTDLQLFGAQFRLELISKLADALHIKSSAIPTPQEVEERANEIKQQMLAQQKANASGGVGTPPVVQQNAGGENTLGTPRAAEE